MQQNAVIGKTVSEQGEESGGPVSHTFYPQAEPQSEAWPRSVSVFDPQHLLIRSLSHPTLLPGYSLL
jgi:hypothetical protein